MFRAFLIVLASAALFFWHKTRLHDVKPLSDRELTEALTGKDPKVRDQLTRELRRAVAQEKYGDRAPASAVEDDSTEESPAASVGVPEGLSPAIKELEAHLYDDVSRSVTELAEALVKLDESQHEERAYVLNLALRLGYDVAPQLVQIGAQELEAQVRQGEANGYTPKRMECLRVGLRLLVYNSTDPEDLREQYRRLRDALPADAVQAEIRQVFPPEIVEQAEKP